MGSLHADCHGTASLDLSTWSCSLATGPSHGAGRLFGRGHSLAESGLEGRHAGESDTRGTNSPVVVGKGVSMIPLSLRRNRHELQWSLIVAAVSATMVMIVATLLAWRARSSRISAGFTALLAALTFALPGPVIGLAIIAVFNQPDSPVFNFLYDQSIVPLCLAQSIRGLPLALLIMWYALQSIPVEMIEHAELDGAPWWTRLIGIALPQRRAALALAWGVALALGLGELSAGILVASPGLTTLTVRIFGLLHYGVEDQVAGICLVLFLAFQLAMLPLAYFARRIDRAR